ncbi:MAG: sel1 repeat family protein [Gammaproteobacteria bacterium]|nr:sel1 repeat family protein [Gammaproteobacteria bacterium]MBL6999328.1 sel1 repeat family protein [Gammaproteobacteria bacterium]
MKKILVIQLAASLLLASPVFAGWEEGMAATQAGDYKKAYTELLPLAEQGNISAQTSIGVMYFNGQGVAQDIDAALVWLNIAANQGHDVAQFNLGVIYSNGTGVDQNFAEAAKWYRLAAKQRYAMAQFNLASLYQSGDGVKKDRSRAHLWFNIAAASGNAEAAARLSQLESEMTAQQIDAAQELAGACVDSGYQTC